MVVMCVSVVFHRCAVSIFASRRSEVRGFESQIHLNFYQSEFYQRTTLQIFILDDLNDSCFEKNGNTLLQKNSLKIVIRRFINLTLYQIEKPIGNVGNHKSFDSFTEFQIDNENSNLCKV